MGAADGEKTEPGAVLYQREVDSLIASMLHAESESEMSLMRFMYGSYPTGSDVYPLTALNLTELNQTSIPTGLVKPATGGMYNVFILYLLGVYS